MEDQKPDFLQDSGKRGFKHTSNDWLVERNDPTYHSLKVGNLSKVRLTSLLAGNAVCPKLLMFFIGKSSRPQCFSEVGNLPCKC